MSLEVSKLKLSLPHELTRTYGNHSDDVAQVLLNLAERRLELGIVPDVALVRLDLGVVLLGKRGRDLVRVRGRVVDDRCEVERGEVGEGVGQRAVGAKERSKDGSRVSASSTAMAHRVEAPLEPRPAFGRLPAHTTREGGEGGGDVPTVAPAWARASVMPLPNPRFPPVTTTVCSSERGRQ